MICSMSLALSAMTFRDWNMLEHGSGAFVRCSGLSCRVEAQHLGIAVNLSVYRLCFKARSPTGLSKACTLCHQVTSSQYFQQAHPLSETAAQVGTKRCA